MQAHLDVKTYIVYNGGLDWGLIRLRLWGTAVAKLHGVDWQVW
jgi:hypothetical protein